MLDAVKVRQMAMPLLKGAELHEEWRLLVLVFCFGGALALGTLLPNLLPWLYGVGVFCAALGWRKGAIRSTIAMCGLSIVVAGTLVHNTYNRFDLIEFEPEQHVTVLGTVRSLEFRPHKTNRLIVDSVSMRGFEGLVQPKRIRISVRTEIDGEVAVGSNVSFKASLSPVGGALVPGGYDFGRAARTKGIQADGFATSKVEVDRSTVDPLSFTRQIDALRYRIHSHIQKVLPGQAGAIVAALTVGLRHSIDEETTAALRQSGLAHLLAISGLHMGLVAATAFYLFELIFAAMPSLALRVMPKKLAVAPAWAISAGYLLLSGSSVSTMRAFIMVSIAMLAVLFDRRVLSIRSVALAALAILVFWPSSILSIGFQMSFAAAAGLVTFYEHWGKALSVTYTKHATNLARKAVNASLMIGVTSLVAQASVAPFSLFHFQTLSIVGILTNMVVLPIVSMALMPLLLAFIGLALFDQGALLAWVIEPIVVFIIEVASLAATPAFAVMRITPLTDSVFLVLVVAFLLLLLAKTFRLSTGLLVVAIGVHVLMPGTASSVFISRSGGAIAEYFNGKLYFSGGRKSSFRMQQWRQYWAIAPQTQAVKLNGHGNRLNKRIALKSGHNITKATSLRGVRTACADGDIVLLPKKYIRYCKGAALALALSDLKRNGPAGINWDQEGTPKISWANPD